MAKKICFLLAISLSISNIILAANFTFDPKKISSKLSTWEDQTDKFKGEKYYSVYYSVNGKQKI